LKQFFVIRRVGAIMIYRFFGRLPLRIVLTVPFVSIILTTTGLTAYFGYRNSQKSVTDLAGQLHDESAARIDQQLNSYLETPLLINNLNLDAIHLKLLNVNDQEELGRHFLAQMQRFDSIFALTYAADQQRDSVLVWRDLYGVDLGLAFLSANRLHGERV
jgi:hypothetical protein